MRYDHEGRPRPPHLPTQPHSLRDRYPDEADAIDEGLDEIQPSEVDCIRALGVTYIPIDCVREMLTLAADTPNSAAGQRVADHVLRMHGFDPSEVA